MKQRKSAGDVGLDVRSAAGHSLILNLYSHNTDILQYSVYSEI